MITSYGLFSCGKPKCVNSFENLEHLVTVKLKLLKRKHFNFFPHLQEDDLLSISLQIKYIRMFNLTEGWD